MPRVLFVCLGNICRSPIAEGVFLQAIKKRGLAQEWEADSAAIGAWHTGKQPDNRALATMAKNNIKYSNRARQIKEADFIEFDYVFGMDDDNISDIERKAPENSKAKILLLGEFDPEGERIIRDPYYDSGSAGFDKCYEQCVRSINAFLDQFKK